LVSQGQHIKKWADLKLEPGLVKSSVVANEEEVAARIKLLLETQKVNTKKVSLGYSGLHSLTRPATLPQLPKAMLPEAVAREARRVLPVPLDQLYISWHTLPCPKGRVQVFIAATPRKIADSLVETLHAAGLEPRRMSIKPLLLTKAATVNTAILVAPKL
jgi:Tfp pilus assembly PilM family ATPase